MFKENLLKAAFDRRGITPPMSVKMGMPKYQTVYRHYVGARGVSDRYALLYEKILGIPRHELRPDLWSPLAPDTGADAGTEAQEE